MTRTGAYVFAEPFLVRAGCFIVNRNRHVALALFVFALAGTPDPARGQSPLPASPTPLSAVDTTGLATGPSARMRMLFEKTFLGVDILRIDVRMGREEAARIDEMRGRKEVTGDALRDSVAAIALDARDAWARIEFQRDLGVGRFLDGIRDNMKRATRAGVITPATYRSVSDALPTWYAFLDGRGIRKGDRMFYRVRGDSLHTAYVAVEGDTLLDQTDVGPDRRLTFLGGYFAPETDFREPLVESLLDTD